MPAPIFDESTTLPARAPVDWRQIRELVGLLLVVIGVVGLVVIAWLWNPLAGGAATFAAILALGVALGIDW